MPSSVPQAWVAFPLTCIPYQARKWVDLSVRMEYNGSTFWIPSRKRERRLLSQVKGLSEVAGIAIPGTLHGWLRIGQFLI